MRIDAKKKAGPPLRPRVSPTLMRRPQGDPRTRRSANLLATNQRTARGVERLNLGLSEVPPPMIDEQLARIEAKMNEIVAALQERHLMELLP